MDVSKCTGKELHFTQHKNFYDSHSTIKVPFDTILSGLGKQKRLLFGDFFYPWVGFLTIQSATLAAHAIPYKNNVIGSRDISLFKLIFILRQQLSTTFVGETHTSPASGNFKGVQQHKNNTDPAAVTKLRDARWQIAANELSGRILYSTLIAYLRHLSCNLLIYQFS